MRNAFILPITHDGYDRMNEALRENYVFVDCARAEGLLDATLQYHAFQTIVHEACFSEAANHFESDRLAGSMWRFIRKMQCGDLVVMTHGSIFHVGRITGPPTHDPTKVDEETAYRRPVKWLNHGRGISHSTASPSLTARMSKSDTCILASDLLVEIEACLGLWRSGAAVNFVQILRPFVPLAYAWTVFVLFYCVTPLVGKTLVSELPHGSGPPEQLPFGDRSLALYLTLGSFVFLLVVQVAIVLFSVYTVWSCGTWRDQPHRRIHYLCVACFMSVFSAVTFWVLRYMVADIGVTPPIFEAMRQVTSDPMQARAQLMLQALGYASFVTLSFLLAAACTLYPAPIDEGRVPSATDGAFASEERNRAGVEICQQIQWLKCYMAISAVYLFCGILFTRICISWALAHVVSSSAILDQFRQASIGILFFQAFQYTTLLLAAFAPVVVRLMVAGSRLSRLELPRGTEVERRRWRVENALSFSLSHVMQGAFACLLPGVVPVVSLLETMVAN